MTQGKRLALIIKENARTQTEFADKLGINRQYLSQLINDTFIPWRSWFITALFARKKPCCYRSKILTSRTETSASRVHAPKPTPTDAYSFPARCTTTCSPYHSIPATPTTACSNLSTYGRHPIPIARSSMKAGWPTTPFIVSNIRAYVKPTKSA